MFFGSLPPISNRATWSESVQLTDSETGDAIDLTAVDEITVQVRDPYTFTNMLSGTLTGGEITVVSTGIFQWRFERSQLGVLTVSKTYEVGCVIEQDDDEVQLIIGTVPVFDGIIA